MAGWQLELQESVWPAAARSSGTPGSPWTWGSPSWPPTSIGAGTGKMKTTFVMLLVYVIKPVC